MYSTHYAVIIKTIYVVVDDKSFHENIISYHNFVDTILYEKGQACVCSNYKIYYDTPFPLWVAYNHHNYDNHDNLNQL